MATSSLRSIEVHALSQEWISYITDQPEDVEARILYGKYLNTFGQRESAIEQFIVADSLDDSHVETADR